MISFPNAKINLGLRVVEKRLDGYHNIETIFYPIGLSDALEVVESTKFKLDITGLLPEGRPENNLVVKAYNLLEQDFKLPPVHIHLHKKIPSGAGLGGGSSDAAFMLKMLNDLFSLNLENAHLKKYASVLGADCPYFMNNKPTYATGIGNIFSPVNIDLYEFNILIIKPPISVNTGEAYNKIKPGQPEISLLDLVKTPIIQWKRQIINDFEKPVFTLYPEIEYIKEKFYNEGAIYASMSGSGSAVYGLFRNLPVNPDAFAPKGSFIYR